MAFSYSSLDVSQRSSLKWLLWPKRQIDAELYEQLPFGNDLKKKYKDIHLTFIFTPQIQERWLWYWFSNPLLSMLIDQITLRFLLQFHTRHFQQWAIPAKIQTWPRIEYMEFSFQVYWRKSTWKYQGLIKKQLEFLGVVTEKQMWNFPGSWFLALEFPRGGTQFCRIYRSESLFSPEFLKVKWQT